MRKGGHAVSFYTPTYVAAEPNNTPNQYMGPRGLSWSDIAHIVVIKTIAFIQAPTDEYLSDFSRYTCLCQ